MKVRLRSPRSSQSASSADVRKKTSSLVSEAQFPPWVRIVGWLLLVAVVVGIVLWLQRDDADLRRELIEECLEAAREDCRFEERSSSRHPRKLAGYFPGDGIEGYSRWTPILKQAGIGIGGFVVGRRLFGQPFRQS